MRTRAQRVSTGLIVGSILLWVFTTPQPWWATPVQAMVTAGSLAGLVGTVVLLQAVWLTSRFPALEREIGLGHMLLWHRRLARTGLALITAHVVLIAAGFSRREGVPIIPQTWDVIMGWPYMLGAAVGFVLLWVIALVSIRRARRRIRYETWWALHLYTYVALALSFMHQIDSGGAFGVEGWDASLAGWAFSENLRGLLAVLSTLAWIALYLAVVASVLWFRILVPARRSRRHALRVDDVIPVASGVVTVALAGRKLQDLPIEGGQFAQFRFGLRGLRWQAHPYSFAGLPDRSRLYLTIGGGGDHARAIAELPRGTRVWFEGPYGTFTAAASVGPHGPRRVLVLVAGLGVTPVASLLRDLPPHARPIIIYRVRKEAGALYLSELRRLAASRNGVVHVMAGSREQHPLTVDHLRSWVPDLDHRHVYLCGPLGFVDTVGATVRELGLPRDQVSSEALTW